MLAALQARGIDLSDLDAVNDALQGSAPFMLPEAAPKARRRTAAAPGEVVSSAASSPVLDRFDALVDFYGEGRKLTQTGQPTLADARSLVKVLGTRDRIDETIGDRTFRTRSAGELPELGFMVRWALAAGALRKERGTIRATTAWRKLDGKPLQQWTRAADALPALGPLAAFHANNRYRGPGEVLDELVTEVLRKLAMGDVLFDEVLDLRRWPPFRLVFKQCGTTPGVGVSAASGPDASLVPTSGISGENVGPAVRTRGAIHCPWGAYH